MVETKFLLHYVVGICMCTLTYWKLSHRNQINTMLKMNLLYAEINNNKKMLMNKYSSDENTHLLNSLKYSEDVEHIALTLSQKYNCDDKLVLANLISVNV